jgi:DNA-binding CsgD family transcriptional regulator
VTEPLCSPSARYAKRGQATWKQVDRWINAMIAQWGTRLGLTPAERNVARCMIRGLSDDATARLLGIGLPTARTHMNRIRAKAKENTRSRLIYAFFRQSLRDRGAHQPN